MLNPSIQNQNNSSNTEPTKEKKTFIRQAGRTLKFISKITAIGFCMTVVGVFAAAFLLKHSNSLADFSTFLQVNATYFLLWRISLMTTIIIFWPKLIHYFLFKAKTGNGLSQTEISNRAWLKSRWLVFICLMLLELAVNFDQITLIINKIMR